MPLKDVLVRLLAVDQDGNGTFNPVIATTDKEGFYDADDLPPGKYAVQVFAPGYELIEQKLTLKPGQTLRQDFGPRLQAATLNLTLTSSAYGGTPPASTAVRLVGMEGDPSEGVDVTEQTDARGAVEFTGLIPGSYEVSTGTPNLLDGRDFAEFYPARLTVRLGLDEVVTRAVDLQLVPARIYGVVLGGAHVSPERLALERRLTSNIGQLTQVVVTPHFSGLYNGARYVPAPIAGVRIELVDARFGSREIGLTKRVLSVDANGNYGAALPPGTYTLRISADGFVSRTKKLLVGGLVGLGTLEELAERGRELQADFMLLPAHTVVVGRIWGQTVVDETNGGQGIFKLEGARVVLTRGSRKYEAVTDGLGVYVLQGVKLDVIDGAFQTTVFNLKVSHPEFTTLNDTVTLQNAGGIHIIHRALLSLQRSGTLRINLSYTDPDGETDSLDGVIDSIVALDTRDVFDQFSAAASFRGQAIKGSILLRARAGRYRIRILAIPPRADPYDDYPRVPQRYDYTWTVVAGGASTISLRVVCAEIERAINCHLAAGSPFVVEGHIAIAGFVHNRWTGDPLPGATVRVDLTVDGRYCDVSCFSVSVPLTGSATTDSTGHYAINLQVPATRGSSELNWIWSWSGDENLTVRVSKSGFKLLTTEGGVIPALGHAAGGRHVRNMWNFYLEPTGALGGLVLTGADGNTSPIAGFTAGEGAPLSTADDSVKVTLDPDAPRADIIEVGSDGRFVLSMSPGVVDVRIDARAHYPYEGSVIVREPVGGQPVESNYTFVLEALPPPIVLDDANNRFEVQSRDDDKPLKGFVLRGIKAPGTKARWLVKVDRQKLREGFLDPVVEVEVSVAVERECTGFPTSAKPVRLPGGFIEGDPSGISTWGGDFDAADLPCGRLRWTVKARTARVESSQRVEWDLWPSEQLFPLSLLTLLGGESSWVPDFLRDDSALKFAPWNLEIKPGVLKVKRRKSYLVYEIGTLGFSTNVKAPSENSFIRLLGKVVLGLQGISAEITGVKMDGKTGDLEFQGKGGVTLGTSKNDFESGFLKGDIRLKTRIGLQPELTGSLAFSYGIDATGLFSLNTPVPPPVRTVSPGDALDKEWRESVGASVKLGVKIEPPLVVIPPPVQWALSQLHILAIRLGVEGTWSAKLAWDLKSPVPAIALPAPLMFHRAIDGNPAATLGASYKYSLETELLGLALEGAFTPAGELTFKGLPPHSTLYLSDAKITGRFSLTAKAFGLFEASHDFKQYTFFEYTYGSESVIRTSEDTPAYEWSGRSGGPDPLDHPWRPGQNEGVVVDGVLPAADLSLARASDGELALATIYDHPGGRWPNSTSLLVARRDPATGDWGAPEAVSLAGDRAVLGATIEYDGADRTVLVWSEIQRELSEPRSFPRDASTAELLYSVFDRSTGRWSEAAPLTADNRPDLSPALAHDGAGNVFLVWARDMDGNVLTVDDAVLYSSRWDGTEWSTPVDVFHAPGARSEIAISARQGGAAIAVVSAVPGEADNAVMVSIGDAERWSAPVVLQKGEVGLDHAAVVMTAANRALVAWSQTALEPVEEPSPADEDEVEEDVVEQLMSAEVSPSGVVVAPSVIAGVEDVVEVEAVLGIAGRPLVSWATVGGEAGTRVRVVAGGPGGWIAVGEAALGEAVIGDMDVVPGDSGDSLFAAYRQTADGTASVGFAIPSGR